MRSRSVAIGALLATMFLAAPAFAQRQGGQGFGGFGGGGFGGGSSLAGLLRIEEVQKEIELLDDQKTAIDKIVEDSRNNRQQGQGVDFQALRDLPEAERTARLAELREAAEKRTKELDEKIKAELVAPQVERLEQLALQQQGVRALANADVQGKLEFTADQKTKVQSIVDAQGQQARGAFGGRGQGNQGQGRPQFNLEEFRAQQQKFESDMLAVLTDTQKTKFEEMKGKPFTFPQRGPGGFGGQGRGQGGQGGEGGQGRRPGGDGQRQRPNPDA